MLMDKNWVFWGTSSTTEGCFVLLVRLQTPPAGFLTIFNHYRPLQYGFFGREYTRRQYKQYLWLEAQWLEWVVQYIAVAQLFPSIT